MACWEGQAPAVGRMRRVLLFSLANLAAQSSIAKHAVPAYLPSLFGFTLPPAAGQDPRPCGPGSAHRCGGQASPERSGRCTLGSAVPLLHAMPCGVMP